MTEPRALHDQYQLVVDIVAPLHAGAGNIPLRADYDYVADDDRIVVIDPGRALRLIDSPPGDGAVAAAVPVASREAAAEYALPFAGGPLPAAILPAVKTRGRAYLPGSTLKGALRSVLAANLLERDRAAGNPLKLSDLAPSNRFAGQPVERRLFGERAGSSALRALQVGDVMAATGLRLAPVRVYGSDDAKLGVLGDRSFVETLAPGVRLSGSATIDRALLNIPDSRFERTPGRAALADLVQIGQAEARRRVIAEREYFQSLGATRLVEFYNALAQETAAPPANSFLIQVGWGAGWLAKSFGPALEASPDWNAIREQFLTPAGRPGVAARRGGPPRRQPGRRPTSRGFPATRHIAEIDNAPALPLGWCRVTLAPAGEPLPPALAVPMEWRDTPTAEPAPTLVGAAQPTGRPAPAAPVEPESPFARLQALLGQQMATEAPVAAAPPPSIAPVSDRAIRPGVILEAEVVAVEDRRILVNLGRIEPAAIEANVLGGGNLAARFAVGQRIRVRVLTAPPFLRLRLP